jgi:hypothetical protein
MPAWRPGVSPNPGGHPASYREARRALQDWASKQGVQRLIELAASPDDRVASVVVLGIFDRAYGKAKEFDPSEEKPSVRVDVSKLTLEQRKQFLAMIRKTATVDVSAFVPSQEGPARAAEPAVAGEAQQIGGKAVETGKP